jgi:flavodoxin
VGAHLSEGCRQRSLLCGANPCGFGAVYHSEQARGSTNTSNDDTRRAIVKTLIAYYSRTGTNEGLAKQLHERVPSDLDQIVDKKGRDSLASCGLAAFLKRTTDIEFAKDPGHYDRVVVVTPVWAGRLPPATRTFLSQHGAGLGQFAVLSACSGGVANTSFIADVEATAGKSPFAQLLVKDAELHDEATQQRIEGFAKEIQS